MKRAEATIGQLYQQYSWQVLATLIRLLGDFAQTQELARLLHQGVAVGVNDVARPPAPCLLGGAR
ncbi:MAG: hypothetical protein EA349_15510 [Halomonadaceae bacterium]|nr:MAG: hypothetical protein EA349_15510 [Halomonadaceae bacterium]